MNFGNRRGFTLIELLVAMSILVIIVLIVGMFFQRASVVWDTGSRRAELLLTGRAVTDYMAQEMQSAIAVDIVNSNDIDLVVLGESAGGLRATQRVRYATSGTLVRRNGVDMCDGVSGLEFAEEPASASNALPLWVDIKVSVSNEVETKVYQSRAVFANRDRDRL